MLVFWGVGAYNRLIRLRATAIAAFAPLQLQYGHYVAVVNLNFSDSTEEVRVTPRTVLRGASLQFEISLKAASAQPLDGLVLRALETAHAVFQNAWARVCNEPQDLAGDLLPNSLEKEWADIESQANHDAQAFRRCIQDYNQGIQQFPANMLAWLFRLKTVYLEDEAA